MHWLRPGGRGCCNLPWKLAASHIVSLGLLPHPMPAAGQAARDSPMWGALLGVWTPEQCHWALGTLFLGMGVLARAPLPPVAALSLSFLGYTRRRLSASSLWQTRGMTGNLLRELYTSSLRQSNLEHLNLLPD